MCTAIEKGRFAHVFVVFPFPSYPPPLRVSAMQPTVGAGKLWPCAVDLDFGNPSTRYPIVVGHYFLFKCKVPKDDIIAIAPVFQVRNQIIRVTFKNEALCQEFLSRHGGEITFIHEDKEIKVEVRDSNVRFKFVRLSQFPMTMDLRTISMRLREFGVIHDIKWETYKNLSGGNLYYPVGNGWVKAKMILEKNIPSFISLGRYRAMVKYSGQLPTCRICDSENHFSEHCPDKRRNIYQYADDDLRQDAIEQPDQNPNRAGDPVQQPVVNTQSGNTPEKENEPENGGNNSSTGPLPENHIVTEIPITSQSGNDDISDSQEIPAGQSHFIESQPLPSLSPNFSVPSRFSPLDSIDPENGETESMNDYCSVTSHDTQEDPQEGPLPKKPNQGTAKRTIAKDPKKVNSSTKLTAARLALGSKVTPPKPK